MRRRLTRYQKQLERLLPGGLLVIPEGRRHAVIVRPDGRVLRMASGMPVKVAGSTARSTTLMNDRSRCLRALAHEEAGELWVGVLLALSVALSLAWGTGIVWLLLEVAR